MISDYEIRGRPDRRLIMLLGTPRSGTTWLANILNSYPGVVYVHEPLSKLRIPHLESIIKRMKDTGELGAAERAELVREWCTARTVSQRPPFFAKDFSRVPVWLKWLAWTTVVTTRRGSRLYHHLVSPDQRRDFDLLIKEIGWLSQARSIIRALDPQLIIIVRHPCAVVASYRRGERLGVMPSYDRARWFGHHEHLCELQGIDRSSVQAMGHCEFLAFDWLLQNLTYLDVLKDRPRGRLVVYEDLCRDPRGVAQSLFDDLGWRLGPQTERFLKRSTLESASGLRNFLDGTQSYFRLNRDPERAMGSWRTELSEDEKRQVISFARNFPHYDQYWPDAAALACGVS